MEARGERTLKNSKLYNTLPPGLRWGRASVPGTLRLHRHAPHPSLKLLAMLMGAWSIESKPFLPLGCWGVKFGKDCSPSNQQHFAAPVQVQDENQEGRLAGPFFPVTVPQPQAGSTFSGGPGLQVALAEHWEIMWKKQASKRQRGDVLHPFVLLHDL